MNVAFVLQCIETESQWPRGETYTRAEMDEMKLVPETSKASGATHLM